MKYTELEVKFAREILDGFLQFYRNMNRYEKTFYCEFCDAEDITVDEDYDHGFMSLFFNHEEDCVVNLAKKVLVELHSHDE